MLSKRIVSRQSELLKQRTMRFAIDVCTLCRGFPSDEPGFTAKRQPVRAATSVAFNYRASCRARSHAEFTAKLGTVVEEADEAHGWLEFALGAGLVESRDINRLIVEANEITAIMAASYGTAREKERALRNKVDR
jgi:four helix bundle protein